MGKTSRQVNRAKRRKADKAKKKQNGLNKPLYTGPACGKFPLIVGVTNSIGISLEALLKLVFEKGIIDKGEHQKMSKELLAAHQAALKSEQPQGAITLESPVTVKEEEHDAAAN